MLYNNTFKNLILVISLIFILPNYSNANETSHSLYKEGLRKYILKDFKGAINDFENAYRINKKDQKIKKMYINALVKQGNLHYKKKNLKLAKNHYLKALSLSGEDKELQNKIKLVNKRIEKEKSLLSQKKDAEKFKLAKKEIIKKESKKSDEIKPIIKDIEEPTKIKLVRKQVKLPFDIDKFIRQQNEENKKILSKIIESQNIERENLLKNMEVIAQSQREDRKFFSRSLLLIIGAGIMCIIIIALTILFIIRKRTSTAPMLPSQEVQTIEYKPNLLLDYTENIDEDKYITDEHYSDIVRAKRLRDLYQEFSKGNLSWDVIQEYISELNHELKSEILNIVEKKIASGSTEGMDNAFHVLISLVTDGDKDISTRSKNISKIASNNFNEEPDTGYIIDDDPSDPLSIGALLQFARMADAKTDRIDHSIRVAEISFKIAEELNDPNIDPTVARRVGLVHDIGYLEIDDSILKKERNLTKKQFEMIKTHTDKGIKFIKHTDPPKIFTDGMMYHHERLDGSGYPSGLKGKKIPTIAKIIAVADFFDAVTSPRPHRESLSIESCLEMLEKLSGKHFDDKIVNIFLKIYEAQPGNEA